MITSVNLDGYHMDSKIFRRPDLTSDELWVQVLDPPHLALLIASYTVFAKFHHIAGHLILYAYRQIHKMSHASEASDALQRPQTFTIPSATAKQPSSQGGSGH